MRRVGLQWAAVAVGVALAVGAGCNSKSAGTGASGAAGGAGAAAGAGGMTGTAGSAGVTGAAGVAGSHDAGGIDAPGVTDAAADVPVASSPTEVCLEALAVQCQRLESCFGIAGFGCDDADIRCPGYYFGPRSLRTVANVQACIASIRQMTCTDIQMGFGSACLAGGTGETGAPCSSGSECASRYCTEIYPTCGTCGAALELGEACGAGATGVCRPGTICHPATRVCVAAPLAVNHARAGEACDLAGNPPVGCEAELLCFPAMRGSTVGTCRPRDALPKTGQPCQEPSPAYGISCADGLRCGLSTADGGRAVLCGDPPPCGTITCGAGQYCFESPTVSIRCLTYATAGQPCSSGAPGGDQRCALPLRCTGGTWSGDGGTVYRGTCNPLVEEVGGACDDVRVCRVPLVCQQGRCARMDPEACFLPSDAGAGQ